MKSTNSVSKYTRSFVLVAAALCSATAIAYLGLSAIVQPHAAKQEGVRVLTGARATSVPVEQTLADGEELVVPAPAVESTPVAAPVATEYTVRLRASLTEEAGAEIAFSMTPGNCAPQPAGRNFIAQSSSQSLAAALDRTICIRALRTSDSPAPHQIQPSGRWASVAVDELPELTELVRQLAYVDETGHPMVLSVAAAGYCESAEGGCNASVNVETISARDNPTTRLRLPGVGVVPLYFSVGAR